jgi:hypothetical protein
MLDVECSMFPLSRFPLSRFGFLAILHLQPSILSVLTPAAP